MRMPVVHSSSPATPVDAVITRSALLVTRGRRKRVQGEREWRKRRTRKDSLTADCN